MPGSDDYGDPPEDPGDPPEDPHDGSYEAYEAVRAAPTVEDVLRHTEANGMVGAEVALGAGSYLGAVMSGLADQKLFDSASQAYLAAVFSETPDAHQAYLAAVRDARRMLAQVFIALRDGDPGRLKRVSKAARVLDPPNEAGLRQARLVLAMGFALSAFYESQGDVDGVDGFNWIDTMAELRALDPSLRGVDSEVIRTAFEHALKFCNEPARTAARLSLELDMFGERTKRLKGKTRLEVPASKYKKALDQLENNYLLASKRHPFDHELE